MKDETLPSLHPPIAVQYILKCIPQFITLKWTDLFAIAVVFVFTQAHKQLCGYLKNFERLRAMINSKWSFCMYDGIFFCNYFTKKDFVTQTHNAAFTRPFYSSLLSKYYPVSNIKYRQRNFAKRRFVRHLLVC